MFYLRYFFGIYQRWGWTNYNFNSLGWAQQLLKKTVVLLYEPQPTMILFLDGICFW